MVGGGDVGKGVMVSAADETGRALSNRGWAGGGGGHERNPYLIRPDLQTSHDDTILVFTAPFVRVLCIWASL